MTHETSIVLAYDLRRDKHSREELLSGVGEQWKTYLAGQLPIRLHQGRIVELFYALYQGEHMFRLDEGNRTSAWIRHGDDSWYVVGRFAKIEEAVFIGPDSMGDIPLVTRIWISDRPS